MGISKAIGAYMREKGYNLREVANRTGLDYQRLYTSLYDEKRQRDLRAEEVIPLCAHLGVDPRDFMKGENS